MIYPSDKERNGDLCNTRRETQIQTKLDQPPWKNGQHQTAETRPQIRTSKKKRPWTPQETMATRRYRKSSNDLNHGRRWWWLWWYTNKCTFIYIHVQSQINYLLTYLLYSVVQSPSWEANWFVASQEIPRISRNPEGSLPHSQASANCLYPWPAQSSPYTHIPPPGDPS